MFANTQMMGMDMAFPDVCMTPPAAVPVPYPNMGLGPMAVPAAYNVLSFYAPTHNLFSTIPLTLGDQPGVMLGVASGMVMGPSRRVTGAFTCLIGYAPTQRLTSFGPQNNTNSPGLRIVPSQPKVIVLSP
ncbi:MAG: DUF4150 domain-containing protein [Polyangiaceae bacterium]|nr:DUF4150 domain-containing protein [Polyangiaceae bacterium]